MGTIQGLFKSHQPTMVRDKLDRFGKFSFEKFASGMARTADGRYLTRLNITLCRALCLKHNGMITPVS